MNNTIIDLNNQSCTYTISINHTIDLNNLSVPDLEPNRKLS